jgi:hypothetical protein
MASMAQSLYRFVVWSEPARQERNIDMSTAAVAATGESEHMMFRSMQLASLVVTVVLLISVLPARAQQKPQWMPGQVGLNAGIVPSPGFSYVNIDINYNSGAFIGPRGSAIPATGSYNVWAVENMFYGVANVKILGANPAAVLALTPATGSLDADIQFPNIGLPSLSATGGGGGLADLFVEPIVLGWHEKRADIQLGEGLMLPTGRYSPGATNNVGTGYFGNHLLAGITYYLTKNRGTSANLFTDWEVHGARGGTNGTDKTPGQAFTDEWGLGQVLPLKKNMTQLLQVGVIGYDQWQVTANGGTIPIGATGVAIPASTLPFYSVHAVGGQLTYILPLKDLNLYFKVEHEYKALNHFEGNTIVFGGAWTLRIPKPLPPKQ